ncbi:MAG: YIP1 family protein [Gemmatimonadetes bacterium]|nr:YIP1 family protein [Gemmatimonadota bacterium]MXY81434.1 YIP1 family protein [Gemmatimonadota bacterium]MYB68437.1 YIP1 family protein [Gemmatimonadota bacterium]
MEAPQAEMSVVGRILRVFYAPSETFEAVAEQRSAADWLVPTFIVAAVGFFSTYLTSPIYVAEAMEQIREQTPAEQPNVEGTGDAIRISGLIAAPVMAFVMLFIGAAIYLLVGKLLGGLLGYGHCLALVAYTSLIAIIQHIVKTPLVLANETMNVQIGLGMFLSEEARQSFGGHLLSLIDPFVVWMVVIAGLGLSIVGQIERSRAYAGVAAITLLFLSIGAFFSTLGPGG